MWIFNADTTYLSDAENAARYEKAPEAAGMEFSHDDVGPNTWSLISVVSYLASKVVPLSKRPAKLMKDKIDTCISCLSCMNVGDALSS